MKRIFLILAATLLSTLSQAQNVIYLFGMNANGQAVINTIPIPQVVNDGLYSSLLSTPVMNLTTTGTSGVSTFNSGTNTLNIPQYTPSPYTAGTGISVVSNVITNTAPDQTVSLTSGNTNYITTSGIYPNFTITPYVPTVTPNVTRPINSATFTISATKQATVFYTINISCTATIGSNSSGKVNLQYSTNGGSNWIDVSDVSNSNQVSLAIVLNSVTANDSVISGIIPANALCRMVSTQSGTTTISFARGMEVY